MTARVAVVSDIHGNRQALEAVLTEVAASDCEDLWCLGDIVGYGGDPGPCIEMIRDHAAICLAGNHDLGVTAQIPIDEFSGLARTAALWTREQITTADHDFLSGLHPQHVAPEIGLYHASPRDPVWEYVLSPLQAELCFDSAPRRLNLIGHTHIALEFHRFAEQPATGETRAAGKILDVAEGLWLLNPGSVGQPRDGDARAAWLELDLDTGTAMYHRTEYDVDGAMWAIRAARLPEELATRLKRGQ